MVERLGRIGFNFKLKLFTLLDGLPKRQATTKEINRLFEQHYGETMPPYYFQKDAGGFIRWQHVLAGQLTASKRAGLTDQPDRGVWRLNEAGRRWLANQLHATQSASGQPRPAPSEPEVHEHEIPAIAKAEWRKSPVNVTAIDFADSSQSHAILDREIEGIRAFLQGRIEYRPTDEKLCDWVQFCYLFELYPEGRDLFALVNPADVHPWHLERTKKLARICALKANTHG